MFNFIHKESSNGTIDTIEEFLQFEKKKKIKYMGEIVKSVRYYYYHQYRTVIETPIIRHTNEICWISEDETKRNVLHKESTTSPIPTIYYYILC